MRSLHEVIKLGGEESKDRIEDTVIATAVEKYIAAPLLPEFFTFETFWSCLSRLSHFSR